MILVTGANGFIGSAFVWELNRLGLPVIAVVDSVSQEERPAPLKNKQFGQFLLKDQLWSFLDKPSTIKDLTWIVHMGANSSTTETNWEHLYENNTLYTQRIFEWCTLHQKSLIYASSAATYGAGELGYDDSTDSNKLKPLNLYGKSKLIFDQWAIQQSKTPPHWYGLKFFNVYGPNEYHKGAMASVAYKSYQQLKTSSFLSLFKSYKSEFLDGEQKRDFIYVKEVTNWMVELTQKTPKSGIYNMGFGQARTWADLARAVFSATQKKPDIRFIEMPENIRDQYQYYTCAEMKKWLAAGMSAPKWSLEKGVTDYVQTYLSKPDSNM